LGASPQAVLELVGGSPSASGVEAWFLARKLLLLELVRATIPKADLRLKACLHRCAHALDPVLGPAPNPGQGRRHGLANRVLLRSIRDLLAEPIVIQARCDQRPLTVLEWPEIQIRRPAGHPHVPISVEFDELEATRDDAIIATAYPSAVPDRMLEVHEDTQ